MKGITYLDWAAAAPVTSHAAGVFRNALKVFGNPSSPHTEGRAAHDLLEDARVRIARLGGVKADAVLFTSGATESNALAIVGQIRARTDAPSAMHVLHLSSAHASTRGCMQELTDMGVNVEALPLKDMGIDLAALKGMVRPETVLVVLDVVCGETGTRFDVRGVRRVLDEVRKGIRIHADASQLPLAESILLTRLGCDTLTLDSQKVGGVRGIGVLLAPHQVQLAPLMHGGGQERGLRPGTPSPALAAAFATALEEADAGHTVFALRAAGMRTRVLERLAGIERMVVNEGKEQVPHILNLSFISRDTDYLAALLDEAGFCVSTRSACATDEEGSIAVLTLTGDAERAKATLRISWGPTTSEHDLHRFSFALVRAVRFLDTHQINP